MDMREIRSRNLNFVILNRYSLDRASALNLDRYDLLRYLSSFNDVRELDKRRMSLKKRDSGTFLEHLSFWVSGVESHLLFLCKKEKEKEKEKINIYKYRAKLFSSLIE